MSYAQFVLVGGYAGKTINLGGHQFVDGVFTYGPDAENVIPGDDEVRLKGDFLAKSFQAYREGSTELAEAQARIKGGKAPAGELDVGAREVKQQDDQAERVVSDRARLGAVRSAITKLDPENKDHWTDAGLPSVEAVRDLSGNKDIGRKDIEALAPKLTRDEAKKLKSDPLD